MRRELSWPKIFPSVNLQWPKPCHSFLLQFFGCVYKITSADTEENAGNKCNSLKTCDALRAGSAEVRPLMCHCKASEIDVPTNEEGRATHGFWPHLFVGGEERSWCRELHQALQGCPVLKETWAALWQEAALLQGCTGRSLWPLFMNHFSKVPLKIGCGMCQLFGKVETGAFVLCNGLREILIPPWLRIFAVILS